MIYFTAAICTAAAFNGAAFPAQQQLARTSDVTMMARSSAKKAPAKKAPVKTSKISASGKLTSAKASAPAARRTPTGYVDVATEGKYFEVSKSVAQFDEIGVLPPIGRWDPLQIRAQGPERYRRFVEMEIKHGRLAMAAVLGVLTTYSGARWPGYLSPSEGILFSDLPGGAVSSWAALPTAAWLQIIIFISFLETAIFIQDPEKAPGDVVPDGWAWARYPDGYEVYLGDGSIRSVPEDELFLGKTWKLNAERNNGRAAMMGITGMIIHESLCGNPIFPIGESI